MTDFQAEKALVLAHYEALAGATPETAAAILAERTASDWHWHGMHPFHEQTGAASVAKSFWSPFLAAMTSVQRRQDIFIAGLNEIDNFQSVWVVSMGHLMGLFDAPFLGIRPTRRICMTRYAEFNKVEGGKIVETALFFDIPQIMLQAGQYPFPPQTGAHLVQPGPMTHDGLLFEAQDPETGAVSLATINRMLGNIVNGRGNPDWLESMREQWHDDMVWWGPTGIGASYTLSRYRDQHAGPFRDALNEGYRFNGHLCRLAEGHFGGFFGWPNLTLINAGGFMGMTGNPRPADMRVVDMYRVKDGKLAENWIFIDMLHWCAMQGLDVLKRLETVSHV